MSEATKPLTIVSCSGLFVGVALLFELTLKLIKAIGFQERQPKLFLITECLKLIGDEEMSRPLPDLVSSLDIFESGLHGFDYRLESNDLVFSLHQSFVGCEWLVDCPSFIDFVIVWLCTAAL